MQEHCVIRGYLFGRLCDDFPLLDRIAGASIYAVVRDDDGQGQDGLTPLQNPDLKPTFKAIEAEELDARAAQALTAKTDGDGVFCIRDDSYEGQSLDVYVCIPTVPVPGKQEGAPLPSPRCLYLGSYKPVRFGDTWYLVLIIAPALWCEIKRAADAWTIVGRLTTCEEGEPIGGVRVKARDTDFTQDDDLGEGVTDPQGHFRIDYSGEAFRKGTFIDIELFGGPDVYFKVETLDGSEVLLDEPRSRGRTRGRSNVGPCMCVRLCAPIDDFDGPPEDVTAWTGIGDAFAIPDASSLNSFDADGYAFVDSTPPGTIPYALTGSIRMTGSIAYTPSGANPPGSGFVSVGGDPIRYRFLVSEAPTSNTLPKTPVPEAAFTRIVGAGPPEDRALFQSVKVGEMVRSSPFKKVNIRATLGEVDANGWLDLNQSILRVFMNPAEQSLGPGEPALTPADLPDFKFLWKGALMGINTGGLTTETSLGPDAVTAGEAVPPGDRMGIERFAFRFEVRAFDDGAGTSFPIAGNGVQLDAAVINNTGEVREVAMAEHLASNSCNPLSGAVHVAYTVHHPHLLSSSITVRSNDWQDTTPPPPNAYVATLSDPPRLSLSDNTNPAVNHLVNGNLLVPPTDADGSALKRCTYTVTLNVQLRKHTGDSADSNSTSQTSFFLDP